MASWDPHLHSQGRTLNNGFDPESVEKWLKRARKPSRLFGLLVSPITSEIEAQEKNLIGVNANRVVQDKTAAAELSNFSLGELRITQRAVGKRIGVDKSNLARLSVLNKRIESTRSESVKLEAQLLDAQHSNDRRKGLIEQRSTLTAPSSAQSSRTPENF